MLTSNEATQQEAERALLANDLRFAKRFGREILHLSKRALNLAHGTVTRP